MESYHADLLEKVARYAAYYFHRSLNRETARRRTLLNYGLNEPVLETFQVGYATPDWRSLTEQLNSRREYVLDSARTLGLVTRGRGGPRDQFRDRYVFPLFSDAGSVVGFTSMLAHWLNEDYEPKSFDVVRMNSSHSPIFDKRNFVLGGHRLGNDLLEDSTVYVSEDPFETLFFHANGVQTVVCPLVEGAFQTAGDHSQTRRIYREARELKKIHSLGASQSPDPDDLVDDGSC
jgi:DNA primase